MKLNRLIKQLQETSDDLDALKLTLLKRLDKDESEALNS